MQRKNDFKRQHEKVTWFFHLNAVPFNGENYGKGGVELVTFLFEFQIIFTKFHFLILSFEYQKWKEKERNDTFNISKKRKKKSCLEETKKKLFRNFQNSFFSKMLKIEDRSFKFKFSDSHKG